MTLPIHCVVDTNVATTANGANDGASPSCVVASAKALQHVMNNGHVYIDMGGEIVSEYRKNLTAYGQPTPGNAFLKWLLTHEWGGLRVTRVAITPKANGSEDYVELPPPLPGTVYDPSDRIFLAVAAAHTPHPQILQSFDSKWWGWQLSLAAIGVAICFLCPTEIAAKHAQKMGK